MNTPEQAAQAQLDAYSARDHGEMRAIYEVVDGLIVKAWLLK